MCGSRPEAEVVTRSMGTSEPGWSVRAAAASVRMRSTSFLLVGPRLEAPEFAAS